MISKRICLSILMWLLPITLRAADQYTTTQALLERFDQFRTSACGITQWFTVKKAKALDDSVKEKDQVKLDTIPQEFTAVFSSDLKTDIALKKATTLDTVLEHVYAESETKDQATAPYDETFMILNEPSIITPSSAQAAKFRPLLIYSHSCSFLLSYAMNVRADYTLPLSTLKGAFGTGSSTTRSASIVIVGGYFPSRFSALWDDIGPSKLYAAGSLWEWYTKHADHAANQKLYYRRFVHGFSEHTLLRDDRQYSTSVSAAGNLSLFFAHIDGNVQARIESQEQSKGSIPFITAIKSAASEKEFEPLPDLKTVLAVIKGASTVRSNESSVQSKFDTANRFRVTQRIEGLPTSLCARKWKFVPGTESMVQLTDDVTSKSSQIQGAAVPTCTFEFTVSPKAGVDSNAESVKLSGLFKTSGNDELELPINEMDIYLSHKASPSLILGSSFPQIVPQNWKIVGSDKLDLRYQITVPFDDQDLSLNWSAASEYEVGSVSSFQMPVVLLQTLCQMACCPKAP
jgi:hypothetical protein